MALHWSRQNIKLKEKKNTLLIYIQDKCVRLLPWFVNSEYPMQIVFARVRTRSYCACIIIQNESVFIQFSCQFHFLGMLFFSFVRFRFRWKHRMSYKMLSFLCYALCVVLRGVNILANVSVFPCQSHSFKYLLVTLSCLSTCTHFERRETGIECVCKPNRMQKSKR